MDPRVASAVALPLVALAVACIVRRGVPPDPDHALVGDANDALGAAVFAATGVAATAVHRAVAGGCLSSCPYGLRCDEKTGTCMKPLCRCPADLVCERIGGQLVCMQPRPVRDTPLDASADAESEADPTPTPAPPKTPTTTPTATATAAPP
jgi:hypothetical protein